jgi:hypothetical protein
MDDMDDDDDDEKKMMLMRIYNGGPFWEKTIFSTHRYKTPGWSQF